jgi:hypothetical protein
MVAATGKQAHRDHALLMAKEGANPAEKAVGIALISGGSFAVIKSLNVFENGAINFDSFIHSEFTGSGAPGLVVSDGGVGMACDPRWSIDDFAIGWSRHLGKDLSSGGRKLEPPTTGSELGDRIAQVAKLITDEGREGTLIVIGSTDPLKFYNKPIHYNADLAQDRAQEVKQGLEQAFATLSKGPPRKIIVANEALTYTDKKDPPPDVAVSNGLARLLFGPGETSGRSALICVMEARPHRIEAGGVGGGQDMATHPGYAISQCCRKRIEEVFGWAKASARLAKVKLRGKAKVDAVFTLALAAYNLIRLPKPLGAPT